jgi:hypothetical protein
MAQHESVTVDHGGLSITTNTASEADLRAEMEAPAAELPPAAPPSPTPDPPPSEPPAEAPATPPRDEKGRFTRSEPPAPAEGADAAAREAPSDQPDTPPQRRHDDSLPRHSPIARMNQALAQKAEADRRAAALEAELARYRQPVTTPVTPSPPPPAADGEPQFEAFADQPDPYTAYVQAWARWDNRRQIAETIAQYEQATAAKAREQAFTSALSKGRTAYPDFDQRLTEADTLGLQVSAVMREAIADSPKAADLVYFLATHPEECTQLALESETTPVAAATVMRRYLESQVGSRAVSPSGNGAAARPAASTAKPPIQPVGSSPVVSDDPPGESASAAEHARYWNRRLKVPGTK